MCMVSDDLDLRDCPECGARLRFFNFEFEENTLVATCCTQNFYLYLDRVSDELTVPFNQVETDEDQNKEASNISRSNQEC